VLAKTGDIFHCRSVIVKIFLITDMCILINGITLSSWCSPSVVARVWWTLLSIMRL